ncbi:Gfo/Idh/MocA family oxidoreductase [Roseibacterium sp. SDUM158017]|uniref:Gfo/Idh/MocA family protein n=1 Tax=Roseicyclus salinarum TaxID=3036773 RepID=UPI0024153C4A|nr:Gfo/Idh/MocA family oxidoreductase [Roseibacterium sp. SDUM158017]MDG4646841.1 Gfo/Idh/MocA family oxidoreductase [Roseibacterium sp. SDUM158017]
MIQSDAPLGVAMIGVGMVAGTHALAIRDATPPVRLVGVLARSADRAARFAQDASATLGAPVDVFPDLDAVAADPRVDAVVIVTPPDARLELVRPLARAGKPVLLEKPVGRTLAEAEEVVALCRAEGVPLGVVFQHRMRAASLAAAKLVAGGALGALGLVEISVPWWRAQSYYDEPGRGTYARDGGGVLISQAIHTIDLALALAGPVTEVTAMTATTRFHDMEAEDVAVAGLRFVGGAAGWLAATTASYPGGSESIALHFDAASLRLAEGVLDVAWRDGTRERHGAAATTGGGADPMAFTHDWHRSILEDFAAALREGRPPAVTGSDALAAHRLIDAITRSARDGRSVNLIEESRGS